MTRSDKRLPVGLIISVALNALLIGVLVMGFLSQHDRRRGPGGPGDPDFAILRGLEEVSGEGGRETIRSAFRDAFADTEDQRIALREARERFAQALVAEPFSQADIEASFADVRAADQAMKARFHGVLADELGQLDDQQRAGNDTQTCRDQLARQTRGSRQ